MVVVLTGAVLVSLFFLGRLVLVLAGVYKEPVLRVSQRYAVRDDLYYPLPWLLMWAGVLMFAGGLLISTLIGARFPLYLIGMLLLLLSFFVYQHPELVKRYPRLLLSYPRWYAELRRRTTREERRRIAYMWLWLPPRLRLYYNSDDAAFYQWADMIIMSTIMQTVEDHVEQQRHYGQYDSYL